VLTIVSVSAAGEPDCQSTAARMTSERDRAVEMLAAKNAEITALREQAMKEGMKPLRISGAMKVAAGVTTIEEVLKVAPPIRDASAG